MSKIRLHYKEILIFSTFVFITLITTYPVIFKMNTSVYGPLYGTDNQVAFWHWWWMKYVWLNHLTLNSIPIIAYPFGVDLSRTPFSWVGILFFKWTVILINEVFIYNLTLLLSFLLSAVIIYCLVYQLTQDRIASVISGIIFAFCPYHFNKAWEQLSLAHIQWLPLYTLTLLNLCKKPIFKSVIWAALAFTLLITFDFSCTYMMFIFTLWFMVFNILYRWKDKLRHQSYELQRSSWKVVKTSIAVILLALTINLPTFYPIFKTMFFVSKTGMSIATVYVRPFHYLFTHSARPLSYFLPASVHPIFGKFTKSMFGSIFYGRGSIEQTLYLGWTPLIFAFIAFRIWRKMRKIRNSKSEIRNNSQILNSKLQTNYQLPTTNYQKDDFYIGFFIFSAILASIFSMPPYFNLGIFKIYFPSFFMYKILPMFRAYARFGILVMLCVSVLAGFGLKYILEKFKSPKKRFAFSTLVTCLVLFEFTNIPPFHVTDISKPPAVYQWLASQPGDFAIVEYPLGESIGPGEADMPYDYVFYQRVHQKKLINGARIGTYAYKVKQKINKIMTPETPGILKWLGAKYAIVHLNKYKTSEDSEAMDILGEIPDLSKQKGLKLVEKFDEAEVYEVVAQPIKPEI